MKFEELRKCLIAYDEVNEDILQDELGVEFLDIPGYTPTYDGQFFIKTEDVIVVLPYVADVDGEGRPRPSADTANLRKANADSVEAMRRRTEALKKEIEKIVKFQKRVCL